MPSLKLVCVCLCVFHICSRWIFHWHQNGSSSTPHSFLRTVWRRIVIKLIDMKTCIHLTKKNRYLITPCSCALFGFEFPMKMSSLLSVWILRHFSARFIFHTCSVLCTVFAPHLPMSFSILPKIFLTKIFCTLLSVQALKRLKLPVFFLLRR